VRSGNGSAVRRGKPDWRLIYNKRSAADFAYKTSEDSRVRVLMMSAARHRVHEPRSPDTARIVIIDHDPVFRVGLAQALRCSRHLRIVAHAANVAVGLVLVCDGSVDIVVLGLDAISTDSAGLISGVARHPTEVGVIVVSACEDPQHARAAFKAGARGFLLKRTVGDELVRLSMLFGQVVNMLRSSLQRVR